MFYITVLFSIAIGAGLLAFYIPKYNAKNYKLLLVFAGSYLFSITILHILPDLFHRDVNVEVIGIFILGGFFLQQMLEYLSSGVEHGHIHIHTQHEKHHESSSLLVLLALFIHAFLEGGLLANAQPPGQPSTLFWGIALHKAPEAFALMSVLLCAVNKTKAIFYLFVFALASPTGIFLSDYLLTNNIMSAQAFTILIAIVTGNFLHISTTIVFESSSDHKFNGRKMGIAVLAAAVAIGMEWFF